MPALLLIAIVSTSLVVIDAGCFFWLRANYTRRKLFIRGLAGHIAP